MKVEASISHATSLQCPSCKKFYDINERQSFATCCNQPLITLYDQQSLSKEVLIGRVQSMWRYKEMLPLFNAKNIVTLGEGWTKIHPLKKVCQGLSMKTVLLKDESTNPTGSFKARGISMAVSKAKELGIEHFVIPTAGNAGGALAAYCAKADIGVTVVMPAHTSATLMEECRLFGAELILINGLIDACGKEAKKLSIDKGYSDISTLKEPYRLEGKKTIGFEIAEQCNWVLPDVIIYPTGGGTGLIGMWKAFKELLDLGWIEGKLPRMIIVQSENCAPMMEVWKHGEISKHFAPLPSIAYGLAVPYPFAVTLMLQVVTESNGQVITVSESEIENAIEYIASEEGLLLSPEGSSTYVAMKKLVLSKMISVDESVLLFNTGSWYKYR